MIRTIAFSTVLLVVLSYIQSTWLGAIAVLGVIPDLSIVALIWISYKNGIVEGSVAGFAVGLAEDFISAAPLGFNAFVKVCAAICASFLHGVFLIDKVLLPFVLGVGATLLKALAAGVLSLLFREQVHGYDVLKPILWIEAAYNGVIAPILFLLLSFLKRILITERGRE